MELMTQDLAAQGEFFETVLGQKVAREKDLVRVSLGSTDLTFRGQATGPPAVYHIAFDIPRNQILSAFEWMRKRCEILETDGVRIHPFESWDAEAFYFLDPAGNVLECIARQALPNERPGEFSAEGFLYVSELGIPVRSVSRALDQLRETGVFVYGQPAGDFAAVGEAGGLVILASDGRPWFGSGGIRASMHPARAVLLHKDSSVRGLKLGAADLTILPDPREHEG